jgi:hypothetical protein
VLVVNCKVENNHTSCESMRQIKNWFNLVNINPVSNSKIKTLEGLKSSARHALPSLGAYIRHYEVNSADSNRRRESEPLEGHSNQDSERFPFETPRHYFFYTPSCREPSR